MDNITYSKNNNRENVFLILLLAVGIISVCLILWLLWGDSISKKILKNNHSALINKTEIASLSVSEFVYNGIAQSLKANGEPDYNVLYKSTVKVSVDAENIDYSFDEEQKIITFTFPDFVIEKPVVDVASISFIPIRNDIYMDDVISLCRNDAYEEAKKSEKLISTAQDNLKLIIEAWYSPVFQEYTFEYRFNAEKGGKTE